jgi:gliding motility-associated lipoprotein GldD
MRYKILILIVILTFVGCKQKYTPKPRGYFRIDFPAKVYHPIENRFHYRFEIPDYAAVMPDSRNPDRPDWINIAVPASKAEIHISYYDLKSSDGNLSELMEESRQLAYKHSIKADAIDEQIFISRGNNVYGTVYKIEGNAASPMQFFLTDSTRHFLRGALYIREVPNIDSLKPVIDFLEPDILRLIETTTWNE